MSSSVSSTSRSVSPAGALLSQEKTEFIQNGASFCGRTIKLNNQSPVGPRPGKFYRAQSVPVWPETLTPQDIANGIAEGSHDFAKLTLLPGAPKVFIREDGRKRVRDAKYLLACVQELLSTRDWRNSLAQSDLLIYPEFVTGGKKRKGMRVLIGTPPYPALSVRVMVGREPVTFISGRSVEVEKLQQLCTEITENVRRSYIDLFNAVRSGTFPRDAWNSVCDKIEEVDKVRSEGEERLKGVVPFLLEAIEVAKLYGPFEGEGPEEISKLEHWAKSLEEKSRILSLNIYRF